MLVVKVGGRVQGDPMLAKALAAAWTAEPGNLCIVHGGGDEISRIQERMGLVPKMISGRRVTTADDLAIVRMVLSGLANKKLVSALVRAGVNAVGVSGEDAGLLSATPRDPETFGFVGNTPEVNPGVLNVLLGDRYLPVISPVSASADVTMCDCLNVNGDDAAAAIAVALGADELLFISDVSAVRTGDGLDLNEIGMNEARLLIENRIADGGMAAKLDAALAALDGGVPIVRIGNVETLRSKRAGTLIRPTAGAGR